VSTSYHDVDKTRMEQKFVSPPEFIFIENYVPLFDADGRKVTAMVEIYKEPQDLINRMQRGLRWRAIHCECGIPPPANSQEALFDHADFGAHRHRAAHTRLLRERGDDQRLTQIGDSLDRGVQSGRIYPIVVGNKNKRRHGSRLVLLNLQPIEPRLHTDLF